MMNFLAAPANLPFSVAACLMLGLAIIEAAGVLLAASPSHFLDHLLPDAADGSLGWLHVGKVPLLVLLLLFLVGFSVGGFSVQILSQQSFGAPMYPWFASIPAAIAGLVSVHLFGGLLGRLVPKDETAAVSNAELIGLFGVIVTGTARVGMAAEVKLRDRHGNTHYLMMEPIDPQEALEEGCEVEIVSRPGSHYLGRRVPK